MLVRNNCVKNIFYHPKNRANKNFGSEAKNKISETNDKKNKNSNLGAALLAITGVSYMAIKIAEGLKKHKTLKNFYKNMEFMDWTEMAVLTSGLSMLACIAPDLLNKEKKDTASNPNKNSLRANIFGASLIVFGAGLAINTLDTFINVGWFFKKKGAKP